MEVSVHQSSLPLPLIMDIADAIHNREQCIRLAVKLNLGEGVVLKVLGKMFTSEMPFDILLMWMERYGHDATGPVLHAALVEMERMDVADCFEKKLLGARGEVNHECDQQTSESVTEQPPALQPLIIEASNVSQMMPTLDTMVEIAFSLPKQSHCVRLAEVLVLGDEFVERVRAGIFTADTAALNVLCKWKQQKSTEVTGRALFDALVAIQRRDIAACFAGQLLGTDDEDWEDFCYDDEHRNFFRILRQHHLDIVAAYECMRCSENFLDCLHRRGIIDRQEYENLLTSQRALLRSSMNRKLLNVVNQKPSQLQTMFATLLCRFQPHLLLEDEDGSSALSESTHQLTGDMCGRSLWQLHGPNLLVDFREELRRWFNQLIVTRPLDFIACEDFQPVSEIYVTLSSISYEEAVKLINGPKTLCGSELLKTGSHIAAESKHSKELLDLHSLLCYAQGMQAKSALLFGSAGTGKSLTVLKILSEWNDQDSASPFKQFDVIVYITGQESSRLSTREVLDFWQLWQMGYNEHQQDFIITHYSHNSEKVLFLVDAWDEASGKGLLQDDTVLKKILHGKLFRFSSVIITSRPAPNAYPLLEDCKRRYSLVGFNNKRLRELFSRRLEEPQASRLFDTLSQSSHLHVKSAVQKTPLFAAMLVQLYKMENKLPGTITALYQSMLENIRSRFVQWVKETRAATKSASITFDERRHVAGFNQVEAKLGRLALAGWLSHKVTFTQEEAASCGKAAVKPQFGLLSEMKEIGMHGSRVLYHFNHLTWQEFLAARSLTANSEFIKKLRVCICSVGVGEHTHLFWRFVAGCVDSCLLPNLVFELMKESRVTGRAPWETDIRLLLLECVAEHIRMQQISSKELSASWYIQLAVEIIILPYGVLVLSGCTLDASCLSSLALVLRLCPNIRGWNIEKSHILDCPNLADALHHLKYVSTTCLSGCKSTSFLTGVVRSLAGSSSVTKVTSVDITVTRECLSAIAQLINMGRSLTEITISYCGFGLSGIEFLSRAIRCSATLSSLVFQKENFAGAGRLLGDMCSLMPQLQSLQFSWCCLNDSDMAHMLAGVQNSCNLQQLHVECNLLTDDVAAPLIQYADRRVHLAQQVHTSFRIALPTLGVFVAGNPLSPEIIRNFRLTLPANCHMKILSGELVVGPSCVYEVDHAQILRSKLQSDADSHCVYLSPGTGDRGAVQIAQFLPTGPGQRLKSLMLHGCHIGDRGAAAIAAAMARTVLQGLDLSDNLITFSGFYQFMSTLPGRGALQYVNLGQNPIFARRSAIHSQLSSSILTLSRRLHSLEIVSVNATQFSDIDANCLENSPLALMAIPSLSALDLSNNEITDKSVAMVTEWMDKLEYLSLSQNRITSDGGKTLVEKAMALLESASTQQTFGCRLQRLWLGGNLVEQSVLAKYNCKIISYESFSLGNTPPEHVPDMFSSSKFTSNSSQLGQPLSETSAQSSHSLFWAKVHNAVCTQSFWGCMEHFREKNQGDCLNYWLSVAAEALANDEGSAEPAKQAPTLWNLFIALQKWYSVNELNVPMVLAIQSCAIALADELMLTCGVTRFGSHADAEMEKVAHVCSLDSDLLCLVVQYLSGLAERYRRRQLHSVADKLLQRLEYVSQYS